jgi:deazaflavin-dependent oxidoreductase (nitroreductase family)
MEQYVRMVVPRGLVMATVAALALVWALFALDTRAWPGIAAPIAETMLLAANLALTARSPRTKVRIVRMLQRWVINPLVRLLLSVGINPLGLAILETHGRVSGQPRRTPVGNGHLGTTFWIIAEHGARAGYVRNIQRDPRVRVRLRVGWRYRWVPGLAQILPDDDPLARQRRITRWHPLRAFNALFVRILGTDLLTVRVQLLPPARTRS